MVIFNVSRSFIPNKTTFTKYCLLYSVDFKAPKELWNPINKAVPGKFHRSGGHGKYNCWQEQANIHRSRVWQIVLFFNAAYSMMMTISDNEFQKTHSKPHTYGQAMKFCVCMWTLWRKKWLCYKDVWVDTKEYIAAMQPVHLQPQHVMLLG